MQCPMDRAFIRNFQNFFPLFRTQSAAEGNLPGDSIDSVGPGLAVLAIGSMNLVVFQLDPDALQGDSLVVGIHTYRH